MTDAAPSPASIDAAARGDGCRAVRCAVCGEPVDLESGRCYACGFSQSELERWRARHADGWRALAKSMRANVTVFWAAFALWRRKRRRRVTPRADANAPDTPPV